MGGIGSGDRLMPTTSAPKPSRRLTKLAPEKELLPKTRILSANINL